MASCTEDYTDWAAPITNSPEEPLGIGITASPAAAVDFATYTAEKVQLFTAAVTGLDGGKATYGAEITNEDGSKSIAIEVDDNFMADRDELESAIYTLWGRRPETRTIPVNVVGLIELNKMTIAATAKTTFTATPDAPEIAENYYIVGGTKDWAQSAASKEQKFNHSNKDVYEDPVFTIVIDANEEGDTWFAIGDDKACDAITNDNNWSLLFGTKLGNGKNGTSGSLDRRTKLSDDGSFCVPAGQRKIRVTINMMEYTYEISTLDFGEFFYDTLLRVHEQTAYLLTITFSIFGVLFVHIAIKGICINTQLLTQTVLTGRLTIDTFISVFKEEYFLFRFSFREVLVYLFADAFIVLFLQFTRTCNHKTLTSLSVKNK